MTMQVLVLAVQNAVHYAVLGAATSGVTLLRGIGGSVGTARVRLHLHEPAADELAGASLPPALRRIVAGGGRLTGSRSSGCRARRALAYQHAYVHALTPVFLVAAASRWSASRSRGCWRSARCARPRPASSGLEDALAAPKGADSLAEVERAHRARHGPRAAPGASTAAWPSARAST